jgi:hypothetical protein
LETAAAAAGVEVDAGVVSTTKEIYFMGKSARIISINNDRKQSGLFILLTLICINIFFLMWILSRKNEDNKSQKS